MHNEFTAITERDGEWFIAYCPEIPGANGQGRSKKESLKNLAGSPTEGEPTRRTRAVSDEG